MVAFNNIGYAAMKLILSNNVWKNNIRWVSANVNSHGNYSVMFFGNDHFSLAHLKAMNSLFKERNLITNLNVVSSEPKIIRTRGQKKLQITPVVKYCHKEGLPVRHWPIEDARGFDLGVVVSFGHMIPDHLIQCFPLGILNVHPSLLPRWRGASPIPHTILAGDKITGVTIMRIKPDRFDIGPIVAQEDVPVSADETTKSLTELLSRRGSEMLVRVIRDLETCQQNERVQSSDGATLAPKLKPAIGVLNWKNTALEIDRIFRAVAGQIPIKASWRCEELRLFDMVRLNENKSFAEGLKNVNPDCGTMRYHKSSQTLQIRCQDTWVGFRRVAIGKKRNMSAKEFHNGFLSSNRSGTQTVLAC